jgi:hypothetical protein
MKLAIIADVESSFNRIESLFNAKPYIDAVLCAGNFSFFNEEKRAEGSDIFKKSLNFQNNWLNKVKFSKPVYFIKGIHEDYAFLQENPERAKIILEHFNIRFLQNGEHLLINKKLIGVIGGIYSEKVYKMPKGVTEVNKDYGKYFCEEDINLFKANNQKYNKPLHALITFEGSSEIKPKEMYGGNPIIKEVVDFYKPKWYIHGHHNFHYNLEYNNTKVVGVNKFSDITKNVKIITC